MFFFISGKVLHLCFLLIFLSNIFGFLERCSFFQEQLKCCSFLFCFGNPGRFEFCLPNKYLLSLPGRELHFPIPQKSRFVTWFDMEMWVLCVTGRSYKAYSCFITFPFHHFHLGRDSGRNCTGRLCLTHKNRVKAHPQ